jgi:[ribosomal protein S5]-alanine N-acetyltransferase
VLQSEVNLIESERLIYKQITKDDKELSIGMSQDELVMKYITGRALNKEEALKRFEEQLAVNSRNASLGFIKSCERESGVVIGYLKMAKMEPGVLEVGYAVLPKFWGKGYASEMLKAMVNHASHFKQFHQLLGVIDVNNPASVKVLTKQGFTFQKELFNKDKKSVYYIKNNN